MQELGGGLKYNGSNNVYVVLRLCALYLHVFLCIVNLCCLYRSDTLLGL